MQEIKMSYEYENRIDYKKRIIKLESRTDDGFPLYCEFKVPNYTFDFSGDPLAYGPYPFYKLNEGNNDNKKESRDTE